jgi:hypothetical protein
MAQSWSDHRTWLLVTSHQVIRPGTLWRWGQDPLFSPMPSKSKTPLGGHHVPKEGAEPASNCGIEDQPTEGILRTPQAPAAENRICVHCQTDTWGRSFISEAPRVQPDWNIRWERIYSRWARLEIKTDKHVWEFERLTQKSPGPLPHHYSKAVDRTRELAWSLCLPDSALLHVPAPRCSCLIKCESCSHINCTRALLLPASGNINNNNVNTT